VATPLLITVNGVVKTAKTNALIPEVMKKHFAV